MRKIITAGAAGLIALSGLGLASPAQATPKNPVRGQFCAAKDVGKTVKGKTCRYDGKNKRGTRVYRWH